MKSKKKLLLLIFFIILSFYISSSDEIRENNPKERIIYTNPELSDRTPFSNRYLIGKEGTSNIYQVELHMGAINIKDKKGEYQPFNQVVNISLDTKQDPIIEWNDKSFSLEGYGIKKGEKKPDKTTELKKGESYYEFITKSNDMKTKEEDDLYVYNFTKTSTDCHKLNDWELVCGESEDYIKVSFKKLEEQNYTILLDEESAILTGGDLSSIDPTISIYVNDSGGKDAQIRESGYPDRNYGEDGKLEIRYYGGDRYNTLINFNISALNIPVEARVDSANFSLNISGYTIPGKTGNITCHRITNSWEEGTGGGYTENNVDNGTTWQVRWYNVSWTSLGGDYEITTQDSLLTWERDDDVFEIKEYTQGVVNGSYINNGVILVMNTTNATVDKSYYSGEASGNEPKLTVIYTEDVTPPTITITHPELSHNYANNNSIPLNYTSYDSGFGVDACWYSVRNSSISYLIGNTTLTSCANTTFGLPSGDIDYTLFLYSNDTVNNTGSASVNFGVRTSKPAVVLNVGNYSIYNRGTDFILNATATDSDGVDTCELYGNWTGAWHNNQTNINITNATLFNWTKINLTEGYYLWNVRCNDTANNIDWATNFTFGIDLTLPQITINSITTNEGNQTFHFNSTETDTYLGTCRFIVYKSDGTINVNSTAFTCNSDTQPTTTVFGDFNLTIFAKDLGGNENSTNRSFILTPSPGGGGAGGGGGGDGVSLERIPVIGLKQKNETYAYTVLEREVYYAKINTYCSERITGKTLAVSDFSADCRLTLDDIKSIMEIVEKLGFKFKSQADALFFFNQYKEGNLEQGYETLETINKYGLFTSILGITNPMRIQPPSLRVPLIWYKGGDVINKTFNFFSNKPIKSCSILEGGEFFNCTRTSNTTISVLLNLGDNDFFDKLISGQVLVISDAKAELTEVQQIPLDLSVYNLSYKLWGVSLIYIAIFVGITIVLLIIIYSQTDLNRWMRKIYKRF